MGNKRKQNPRWINTFFHRPSYLPFVGYIFYMSHKTISVIYLSILTCHISYIKYKYIHHKTVLKNDENNQ